MTTTTSRLDTAELEQRTAELVRERIAADAYDAEPLP
jgi:hypothetical protein